MSSETPQGRQYPTDPATFINDLDGGVFAEKLGRILSDVCAGAMDHEKTGEITLKFTIKRVPDTFQAKIEHKITHKKPLRRGDVTENNTTTTLMHVSAGGEMSIMPKSQVPNGQMHLYEHGKPNTLVQGEMGSNKDQS